MSATIKVNPEDIKKLEDEVCQKLMTMDPLAQATMYLLLYACGMTLEKARSIRLKAGATN